MEGRSGGVEVEGEGSEGVEGVVNHHFSWLASIQVILSQPTKFSRQCKAMLWESLPHNSSQPTHKLSSLLTFQQQCSGLYQGTWQDFI